MTDNRWKIHKFGGSSLADADCFRRVAGIILARDDARLGVVVSAMAGMTDALIERAGGVASRVELMREVWGHSSAVISRTVDTHVTRLRKKLKQYNLISSKDNGDD